MKLNVYASKNKQYFFTLVIEKSNFTNFKQFNSLYISSADNEDFTDINILPENKLGIGIFNRMKDFYVLKKQPLGEAQFKLIKLLFQKNSVSIIIRYIDENNRLQHLKFDGIYNLGDGN